MLKEIFSRNLHTESKTVCNAIITLGDIDDSGKGKRFKSRFIQPGLAGYPDQFGTVLVKKETLDQSLNTIIGAPVIINHTDVTEDNADDLRVGVISNAYYNDNDGWYWCEGVIWDETAQNLITDKNWSVSCSYDFLEQDDEGGTENNIPYDREFTKLNFVHLALVDNPRYERANIVFNSKDEKDDIIDVKLNQELYKLVQQCNNNKSTLTNKDLTLLKSIYNILKRTNNGWVTLKDKVDENGKPLVVFIPSYIPSGGAALDFHRKIATEKPKANVVYEFAQTKANISEEQKSFLKSIIGNILGSFKVEPPLKGVNVCTIGGGCLGVAISSRETRTLSLDSKIFKDKGSKTFNKSVESGWLTRTDKDVITSVLTHELGHIITAGTDKKEFWDKIKEIKSEYVKNIDVEDISNKDYISKYARTNKDEFVAECFAQATLLKSPSKYAKMVLNEINNNFKLSAKEVKQLRLFNAVMEVFNMNLEFSINNDKSNKDLEITWVESEGAGYCLTEEDYKKRKKEVEQHAKEEMDK